MPITPLFNVPWGILANKREAKLAAGAITRGATVRPAQRSRYNAFGRSETSMSPLGMGYVEAVLGVLLGIVGTIAYDAGAQRGRVAMRSTGGPTAYDFSWKVEPGRVVFGGFAHSEGHPTYQAAIVGLSQLVALHCCGPSPQTDEIVTRWYALVDAMEAAYARVNQDAGWSGRTIAEAAANSAIAAQIEGVCDALYHAMRYQLPALEEGASVPRLAERGLVVTAPDVLAFGEGRATVLPGSLLINPTAGRAASLEPGATATTLSTPRDGDSADDAATTAAAPSPAAASPSADTAAAPAPSAPRRTAKKSSAETPAPTLTADGMANPATAPLPPTPAPASAPAAPRLYGSHLARVKRALATASGPLMLVGPTSTGKTTLAVFAGRDLDWGAEIMVCDPGMDDKEPFGGYARTTVAPIMHAPAETAEPLDVEVDAAEERAGPSATSPRLPAWAHILHDRVSGLLVAAEAQLADVQGQLNELGANRDGAGWEAIDGPIARWARRALHGERVLLIIDELARGHESLIAAVMRVLNTYDRDTVERQGLRIPDGAERCAAFHIIDLWHTRERLVVPADRVKIIATANLGDRYTGLDLSDPAFRRRWTGGWLYLGTYQPDTVGEILADKLGLPISSALITKMQAVAAQVEEYQRKEDKLIATLDLATLITWGQAVITLAAGMGVAQAWAEAASDVWLERVCPMKGTDLDPDVRNQLLRLVAASAPTSIR